MHASTSWVRQCKSWVRQCKSWLRECKMPANNGPPNSHCRTVPNQSGWALRSARRLGLAATVLSCCAAYAAAESSPAAAPPVKIAVFAFELEDFSAAGQAQSANPESTYLAEATDEAVQQLRASGRYTVIDAVHSDMSEAKGQGLRNC